MNKPIYREIMALAIVTFLAGHRHENSRSHEAEQYELLTQGLHDV